MTNEPATRFYSFGAFRVDANERLLFKGDREIPLTPKVFDTLLALIENSSHVLTRKELMQKVWPDSFVEENNLAQNISILRKALGESYIQTIPKRGYRFVADVSVSGGEEETLIIRERRTARIVVERDDDEIGEIDGRDFHSRLGIHMRSGLHTGECELVNGKVAGIAAEIGLCIANEANAGEVLVSRTVKDLVAGSGIQFREKGVRTLAGCGDWRLFTVERAT